MADGTRFAGRVFDGSGTAVENATINLYDVGTVTPVRATTTTNSTGDWEIDHATRGLFDIEIVNGTTTSRITQDTEAQFKSMWLWNADADEFALGVTRTEDAASVEVAYFEGDRATMADGDLAYISLRLSDSAGNQDEQARIGWQATTVLNGATQDGDLILSALVNNTLTEFMRLDGSAASINFPSGTILDFGSGDVTITHSANTLTIAGVATRVDWAAGIFELNNAIEWDTGVAVVAGEYAIGRDADATNQLHLNVPTRATFEFSVNDVAQMTLSATAVDFLDNSITTTGALTIASFGGNWTNAGRTVADLGIVTTVDINGGTLAGVTVDGGLTWSAAQNFGAFITYINDSANTSMAVGLTINQGGADNEILALKSSDVAHGMTSLAETDTYFKVGKASGAEGGAWFEGYSTGVTAANAALLLSGVHGSAPDTTDTGTSKGVLQLAGYKKTGTTSAVLGATDNLITIGSSATYFLVKGNGDIHVTNTTLSALDDYPDALLMRAGRAAMAPVGSPLHDDYQHLIAEYAPVLEEKRIMFFERDDTGRITGAMNNVMASVMLSWDAHFQTYQKIAELEGQLNELRHRLEAGRN